MVFFGVISAVIKDDFREQPQNTEVAQGQEAALQCKPPRGEPEPRVRWEKDRERVRPSERFSVDEFGTLHIRDARKEDDGSYQCIAYNIGGERESAAAILSVRGEDSDYIRWGDRNNIWSAVSVFFTSMMKRRNSRGP